MDLDRLALAEAIEALTALAGDPEGMKAWASDHIDLFDEDTIELLSSFAKSVEDPRQFGFALELFDLLVFACEQRQQPRRTLYVLLAKGQFLEGLCILDDALEECERALRVVAHHKLGVEDEYDCLVRKAVILQRAGVPERALPLLERTVELAKASGASLARYEALGNLAIAYDAVGNHEKALALHREALRGLEWQARLLEGLSANDEALAIEYLNTGLTYAYLGRDDEAMDSFRRSADLFAQAGEHAGIEAYGGVLGLAKAMMVAGGDLPTKPHPFAAEEARAHIQLARTAERLKRPAEFVSARDRAAELVHRYSLNSLAADLRALYEAMDVE